MAKNWRQKQARKAADLEASQAMAKARAEALMVDKGTRMANPEALQVFLKALRPWKQRTRGDTFGHRFWVGKGLDEFDAAARGLEREIFQHLDKPDNIEIMKNRLVNKYGYGPEEAQQELDNFVKKYNQLPVRDGRHVVPMNPPKVLSARKLGVPNASADEDVAVALLKASGVRGLEMANRGDPITATDILAQVGSGEKQGIDAQRMMSGRGDLNLGMFQQLEKPQQTAIAKKLQRAAVLEGNKKFGVLLDEINNPNLVEDKFMQSLAYNKAPTEGLQTQYQDKRKDFLMTSDMRQWYDDLLKDKDAEWSLRQAGFEPGRHGAYDPTIATDYNLVNLNHMRDELYDHTMKELDDKGYRFTEQGRYWPFKVSLKVPKQEVMYFSQDGLLDREIVNELVRRRNL